MHRTACSALLTLCLLPGCASTAAPEGPLAMARSLGTLQCETRETTATALAQTLRDAGVMVQAVGCAHDGRMRPAVCGAPDGRLAVVDIASRQRPLAESLGWKPLSTWPAAQRQPC